MTPAAPAETVKELRQRKLEACRYEPAGTLEDGLFFRISRPPPPPGN